ncbi:MAG: alpha/beta fold hydrolase [Chryseolinea sp.]
MKAYSLTVLLLAAVLSIASAQKKTYILVHGGWHGAWSWQKVVPLLMAEGNTVLAIDLPGHGQDKTPVASVTFNDYIKKVVSVANEQKGPVILVGHSMAGVVIAQASEELGPKKVSKLIFLDAFMPRNGESVLQLAEKAGIASAGNVQSGPSVSESLIMSADGKTSTIKKEAIKPLFYHDCSPSDVAFAEAHIGSQPMVCLATPVSLTEEKYGRIPKYYILCTMSKDLDKSSIAGNVKCEKLYSLESSHSPFFSMPKKLVAILLNP